MKIGELLVVIMFGVFVLFGVASFIGAPIIARRFYRDIGFLDQGKSTLEIPTESVLLEPVATSHLYRGEYRGQTVEQCQAYPKSRRHFTLSKAMRKHNQSRWSITQVTSEETLPAFCLLPISEAATVFLMLNETSIDLSDDKELENRYFLRTDHPDEIKQLITGDLRQFLLARELISIECVDNSILIKRSWPTEKIRIRLRDEMDCAVDIIDKLTTRTTS